VKRLKKTEVEYLKPEHVAELLCLSKQEVINLIQDGELDATKISKATLRVSMASVRRMQADKEQPDAPPAPLR